MSSGTSKPLGALGVLLGGDAQLVDLPTAGLARLAAAAVEQPEERLAHRVVGVGDDREDVAVVVLQRALVRARAAAVDDDGEEDQEQQDDADQHRLPDARGVRVGPACAAASRRVGSRPRACRGPSGPGGPAHSCGFVTLVEERHDPRSLQESRGRSMPVRPATRCRVHVRVQPAGTLPRAVEGRNPVETAEQPTEVIERTRRDRRSCSIATASCAASAPAASASSGSRTTSTSTARSR